MIEKLNFFVFVAIVRWIANKLDITDMCGCYIYSESDMKKLYEIFNNDED
jgi:hypothetical protein